MISYLIEKHQDTPVSKDYEELRNDSEQVFDMSNHLIATVKSRIDKYEAY